MDYNFEERVTKMKKTEEELKEEKKERKKQKKLEKKREEEAAKIEDEDVMAMMGFGGFGSSKS